MARLGRVRSMKHLRQYIRQILLTEGAKQPEDLTAGHTVEMYDSGQTVTFSLVWRSPKSDGGKGVESGKITITQDPARNGPCLGSWEVISSAVRHGWGPLLYDVAMEYAGSDGLMADRRQVSRDAMRVWDFYLNSRSDVKPKQLDVAKHTRHAGFLTPNDDTDDCRQDKFMTQFWVDNHDPFDNVDNVDDYLASPMTKAFVKSGTPTTNKLKEMGKLKEKKDQW